MEKNKLYLEADHSNFIIQTDNPGIVNVHGAGRGATKDGFVWRLPAYYPDGVMALKDLKKVLPEVTAGTANALQHIEYLKTVPEQIEKLSVVNSLDYTYKHPPMLHQLRTIEYLLHYPALAVLLEQGLGKSYIALVYLAMKAMLLQRKYRALILTPKIVRQNWKEEALRFTDLQPRVYSGTKQQRKKLREELLADSSWDIVITNYESIAHTRDTEELYFFKYGLPFDAIILDEGHRVKGHDSTRSKAVLSLAHQLNNRIILSGTISLGTPLDMYMPFTILNPSIFGTNFWSFRNKYCAFGHKYNKHIITGYKHLDVLKTRVDPYIVSMTRDECLELPDRVFETRYYPITDDQQKLYNAIAKETEIVVDDTAIDTTMAVVKVTKLMQVLSGFLILPPKIDNATCNPCPRVIDCVAEDINPWDRRCMLYEEIGRYMDVPKRRYFDFPENPKLDLLLEDINSIQGKIIVWATYQREIEHITTALETAGIAYTRAGTPDCVTKFNTNPKIKVFLGQISQGIGITLNSASTTIYYNRSMKLEDYLQSMDRNYRIGQKNKVLVINYVYPGSIEESVVDLLSKKNDVKTFLQQRTQCTTCTQSIWCLERAIVPYSEKCVFHHTKVKAERKKKLSLAQIGRDNE